MAWYRYEEKLTVTNDWPDARNEANNFAKRKFDEGSVVQVRETTKHITVKAVYLISTDVERKDYE